MNILEKILCLTQIKELEPKENPFFSREQLIQSFQTEIPDAYKCNRDYINLIKVLKTSSSQELSYILENSNEIFHKIINPELSWCEIKYFRAEKRSLE